MPINDTQMRLSLGMDAGSDEISKFMPIVGGYGKGEERVNGYRDMYLVSNGQYVPG
jgi:hypothetical protein